MDVPSEAPGRFAFASRQRALAALILLPGLLVAGMAARDGLILRALQGRSLALRASMDGLPGQVRMVTARRDLLVGAAHVAHELGRAPDPTPGWERVLALLPPEAMAGRVVFCSEGSTVTIHGRAAEEPLLARVASELERSAGIERVELGGRGSDDVILTVVPSPVVPSEEEAP